jgi:hypothetical protein
MTGSQREAIEIMKMMESVTVNADLIAQALGMNPGVLRKHVKDGEYQISKYEICGDRVRFFRKDFLQKIGEIPEDPEEQPTDQLILKQLIDLNEGVTMICQMLTLMMKPYQLDALNELIKKKTAGAGTPTD